jgi:hypothetical protein
MKGKKFEQEYKSSDKFRIRNYMTFSPNGEYLAAGTHTNLTLFMIDGNQLVKNESIFHHTETVFGGSFSDDGLFLTSCSADGNLVIWEVNGVKPSIRSLVADYLGYSMTTAQKKVLTPDVLSSIIKKLDNNLTLPRDEFETTEQYNQRRKKLSEQVLLLLQEQIIKKNAITTDNTGKIYIPVSDIIGYNADLKIYKIRFLDTEAGVYIPIEPAKQFKQHWKKASIIATRKKSKSGLSYEFDNFRLVHPVDGKTYPMIPLENPFQVATRGVALVKGPDAGQEQQPSQEQTDKEQLMSGTSRVVLFATNVYDNFGDLTNPVLDASTISEEMTFNYQCKTEVVLNPTLNEIITKIRDYAKLNYSENDNLLLFFAGHGIYDEVFKEGYIISKDSESNDLARTSYLSHSNLRTMVNNIPCNHILLVMDVCFGGTFDPIVAAGHRGAEDIYDDVSKAEFVKRKMRYKTRLYLTSGGKEYVPDGRPGQHSPFARKFLEALRDYGGADRILTVYEVVRYVEKADPQPHFGEFGDNEPGSDFLLISK